MTPTHCPDCHQPLSEPQRSIGYLGPHPVWCATCDGLHRATIQAENESTLDAGELVAHFSGRDWP